MKVLKQKNIQRGRSAHSRGRFAVSWVDIWKPGNVMTVGPERENMSGKHRHISV
jgi:hypothetical protein